MRSMARALAMAVAVGACVMQSGVRAAPAFACWSPQLRDGARQRQQGRVFPKHKVDCVVLIGQAPTLRDPSVGSTVVHAPGHHLSRGRPSPPTGPHAPRP